MKQMRKIIHIDEEKCDGCGLCAAACVEGAIQNIGGKAKLVSEVYCDGLGACIGECPQGAITIEERAAEAFDPKAVERHLAAQEKPTTLPRPTPAPQAAHQGHVCPGTFSQMLRRRRPESAAGSEASQATTERYEPVSELANWPVQIRLVPVQAPYFDGADLLIAADCAPFAYPDFHRRLLANKVLLIGCQKLDDAQFYREKLAQILQHNDIRSIEVAFMEVPCCFGLVQLVKLALADAGRQIPLILTRIGIRGAICETGRAEPQHPVATAAPAR